MKIISLTEAKAKLSALLERVAAGEDIAIGKSGRPIGRLVRFQRPETPRVPGKLKRKTRIADDFDELPAGLTLLTQAE